MKRVAVIYNNSKEWRFFQETLMWNLSKQNKVYKCTTNAIVDIEADIYYFAVRDGWKGIEQIRGCFLHDYVSLVGIIDSELLDQIKLRMNRNE